MLTKGVLDTAEQWEKRFERLTTFDRAIADTTSLRGLLYKLAEVTVDLFPMARVCFIWQNDADKKKLVLAGKHAKLPSDLEYLQQKDTYTLPMDSVSGDLIRDQNQIRWVIAKDIQNNPRFYWKEMAKQLNLHGMLAVLLPGLPKSHPLGCINIFIGEEKSDFPLLDCELLANIAQLAASVFQWLADSLILSAHREIGEIIDQYGGNLLAPRALTQVAQVAAKKLEAEACSIFLRDTGGTDLRLMGTTGSPENGRDARDLSNIRYPLGVGITGWVAKKGVTVRLFDRSDVEELRIYGPDLKPAGHFIEKGVESHRDERSYLVAPIVVRRETIGVIRAIGSSHGSPFPRVDQEIIESIAKFIAPDLKRERQITESIQTLNHQLVSPIQSMEESCNELVSDETLERNQEIIVKSIADTCQLACSIANNFSMVQNIVAGVSPKPSKKRASLLSLLIRAATLYQPAARRHAIQISIDENRINEIRGFEADEALLLQVFQNIFDNGIKYSLPRTTIRVSLFELKTSNFTLCIHSVGIPISGDEVDHVFDHHFRTDFVKSLKKPGMGIGLSVAKAIVEAHGGRIWVESESRSDSSGSADVRFYIKLQL